MLTCLIRTAIIFLFLVLMLRITGKRQIGELEISELVSTFLISEIASAPIGNQEIPLSFAIVPILTIISLEIIISFLSTRSALLKKIFLGSPILLIRRGELQIQELSKARMSVEELLSELRQNGITDVEEAEYAILENDGTLSVTPKAKYKPLTPNDLQLKVTETGIAHALIVDGTVKKDALRDSGKTAEWLTALLKKRGIRKRDVFLLTVNDSGKVHILRKE